MALALYILGQSGRIPPGRGPGLRRSPARRGLCLRHPRGGALPGQHRRPARVGWRWSCAPIPTAIPTLEQLGLPTVVRDIALEERGLVLVTGITGSGKTTTLASMVGIINATRRRRSSPSRTPSSSSSATTGPRCSSARWGPTPRASPRGSGPPCAQDPDVILVGGDARPAETIDVALKAAETGHLVLPRSTPRMRRGP